MTELLAYNLKVAALLAVFYMFYRLLLSRETLHRLNRVVLLLTAVASFVLPLCVITIHRTVSMPMPATPVAEAGLPVAVQMATSQLPWWQTALAVVFVMGATLTLGHTLLSLLRVWRLISRSQQHRQPDGTVVCVADRQLPPFSWMRYIVLSRNDYEHPDEAILRHERAHIRLHHSADLLLVDTLTALQWFNPAIWMLRQDLRAIHEYEADAAVLSQGIDVRQYQYLLIRKAASIGGYSIANGINHSTLKNRINMMLHKKSSPRRALRALALLPVAAVALALNARTVTSFVYDEPQNPVKKGQKAGTLKISGKAIDIVPDTATATAQPDKQFTLRGIVYDAATQQPVVGAIVRLQGSKQGTVTDFDGRFNIEVSTSSWLEVAYVGLRTAKVPVSAFSRATQGEEAKIPLVAEDSSKPFDVCDQMPEYPGGFQELMKFLATNVRYPEAAIKTNTQGRVIVSFVVNTDGSISDERVVRSISPELDAEALHVVGNMPNWKPGMQNGQLVRVKYTLPINFRLTGNEENTTPAKQQGMSVMVSHQDSKTATPVGEASPQAAAYAEPGNSDALLTGVKVLIVDGKEVPVDQLSKFYGADIQSIYVDKSDPDHATIRITTKNHDKSK